MNSNLVSSFTINLSETTNNSGEIIEDPWGELSDFELGLKRFCSENNYRTFFKIGEEEGFAFFDYDIISILEERFPQLILKLLNGDEVILFFVQDHLNLRFQYLGKITRCNFERRGRQKIDKTFYLETSAAIKTLISFLEKIMKMAIDGGYIKLEDAEDYLAPCQEVKIKLNQQ